MEEGIVIEEAVIVATADKDKAINEMATISARTFLSRRSPVTVVVEMMPADWSAILQGGCGQ